MTTLDILWVAPQAGDLPRSLQALVAAEECRVRQAVGVAAGVAAWQENRPDLVLLTLADAADLDLLAAVAADVPDPWPGEPLRLPVVVVVAAQPESLAAQALQQGAMGYLVQGQITPLALRQALHQGVAYQRLAQRCCQTQRQVDTLAQQHHQDAARWEFLVQTSPAVIYSTEPTANYACTFVSDRVAQVLGYSPAEVYAQPDFWVSHLHPDDAPQVLANHDHLFEQGWLNHEYRLRHRQGHHIWVQDELHLVRDPAGKPLEIVGYFTEISDRKHQEGEKAATAAVAQALSDRLTLALQAGAFGTWDWDLQQEAVWDQRIYEIYGLQDLGRSATYADWRACVHPEDIAAAEAQLQAAIEGQPFDLTFRIYRHDDGRLRWVQSIALVQRDAAGNPIRMVGLNRDVTEQRRADQQFQDILDGSPAVIYVKDLAGRHLLVNRAFTEMFGCDAADILGKTNHDLFSSAVADRIAANDQYLLSLGEVRQFEETIAIGDQPRVFLSDKFVLRDEQGQPYAICGMSTDITTLKRIEQALRESEQLLETVLTTTPIPIYWKDRQSVYQGGNQAAATALGLASTADFVGKTDCDLPWTAADAAAFQAEDQQVMASGQPILHQIYHLPLHQGKTLWLEMNKVPLRDSQGTIIGVLGTAQDISDRKQAELDLQRTNQELARATRLKDEFLANMSHELRTPLNAILGISESLQAAVYGPITDQQRQSIATIERTGSHLLALINDILDVAKIEAGQMALHYSAIEVPQLCETSLAFVKEQALKKRIQLSTTLPEGLLALSADERRIRQVLINLLNNAVKFTPAGGRVTLAVSYVPLPLPPDAAPPAARGEAEITSHIGLRFAVTDTGIGIAPEDIPSLFQPFHQIDGVLNRQHGGTGLGLALVKHIVELHGGTVALTSEVGVGSCFSFTLPLPHFAKVQTPDPEAGPPLAAATPKAAQRRLLLAEDNPDNVATLAPYLEMQGYEVLVAADGAEAIALATRDRPDLIVMDVQMPNVDGLEAMGRIRANPETAAIPMIALTAFAMAGDEERCLAAGANAYLSKPVKLKQLAATIRQWLSP